ncbi:Protein of unknown function [Gryllus bimaculatus]|nr:Protein of unknown function [Gryllus bimaculatus]
MWRVENERERMRERMRENESRSSCFTEDEEDEEGRPKVVVCDSIPSDKSSAWPPLLSRLRREEPSARTSPGLQPSRLHHQQDQGNVPAHFEVRGADGSPPTAEIRGQQRG